MPLSLFFFCLRETVPIRPHCRNGQVGRQICTTLVGRKLQCLQPHYSFVLPDIPQQASLFHFSPDFLIKEQLTEQLNLEERGRGGRGRGDYLSIPFF